MVHCYRRCRRRLGDPERGSVTAELLIATPVLFLLVLSVVQFALFEHATHIAEAAAEQGLAASRVANGTAADGNAAATNLLDQIGNAVLASTGVNTTRGDTTTSVTVTGHAEAVLPWLTLPVRVEMNSPTERFVAEAANGDGGDAT
jgi:Flp pilus assembly protein TadG